MISQVMIKPVQLRCPYTLRALTDLAEVSREHIIPDALGGPNGYSVQACRATNSEFGRTHDAAFLNEPLIAMMRTQHGVEGRSGPAKWKMEGETLGEGRPVQITFSESAVDVYHKKPVEVHQDENGKGYRIVAPSPQSDEVLEQLKKGLARKGMAITEPKVEKEEQQTIHSRLTIDFNVLQAGLMKIAYLAAFDFIGDVFLDDPLNPEWQNAIRVTNSTEAKAVRIHGACFEQVNDTTALLLPNLAPHEHGIAIVNLEQTGPVVLVRLFGSPLLTGFAKVSETQDFGLQEAAGKVIIVDAATGQMRKEFWMDHLVRLAQASQIP